MSGSTQTIPRLKETYRTRIVPELMKKFSYANPMMVPRLSKIVITMSVNDARDNIKALDVAAEDLAAITGQKPQVRRAKKAISNFKLRKGLPIALRVTLRGDRMYEFIDLSLIHI